MQSFGRFRFLFTTFLIFSSSIYGLGSESKNLDNFTGRYLGEIESSRKMLPSITIFKLKDGVISGEYIIYETNRLSSGKLSSCKVVERNILECRWQDKYGNGNLVVAFSKDFQRLVGEWDVDGDDIQYRWDGLKYSINR